MANEATVKLNLTNTVGLRGRALYGPGEVEMPVYDAQQLGLISEEDAQKAYAKSGGATTRTRAASGGSGAGSSGEGDDAPKFTSKSASDYAAEKKVDLSNVEPSGSGGKYTVEDVEKAHYASLFASKEALAAAQEGELTLEEIEESGVEPSGEGGYTVGDVDAILKELE